MERVEECAQEEPESDYKNACRHIVYVRGKSVGETAADLMRAHKWVYDWLRRYDTGDLDDLRNLPKSGRPTRVRREMIQANRKAVRKW